MHIPLGRSCIWEVIVEKRAEQDRGCVGCEGRRAFVGWLGVMALGGLGGCVKQIAFDAKVGKGGAWVPEEKLKGLREGKAVLVLRARGVRGLIYVRHLKKSGYLAVSSRCTHRGCEVDPEPFGYDCPCHGARFDVEGKRLGGPARRPLRRFAVRQGKGGVWIDLQA